MRELCRKLQEFYGRHFYCLENITIYPDGTMQMDAVVYGPSDDDYFRWGRKFKSFDEFERHVVEFDGELSEEGGWNLWNTRPEQEEA